MIFMEALLNHSSSCTVVMPIDGKYSFPCLLFWCLLQVVIIFIESPFHSDIIQYIFSATGFNICPYIYYKLYMCSDSYYCKTHGYMTAWLSLPHSSLVTQVPLLKFKLYDLKCVSKNFRNVVHDIR